MIAEGKTWNEIRWLAGDHDGWRRHAGVSYAPPRAEWRGLKWRSKRGKDGNNSWFKAPRPADRSVTEHNYHAQTRTATLRITVEQSLKWNFLFFITFIDYEKAFDSFKRNTLWQVPRHCAVPQKFVPLIQKIFGICHTGLLTLASYLIRLMPRLEFNRVSVVPLLVSPNYWLDN